MFDCRYITFKAKYVHVNEFRIGHVGLGLATFTILLVGLRSNLFISRKDHENLFATDKFRYKEVLTREPSSTGTLWFFRYRQVFVIQKFVINKFDCIY